MRKTIRLLQKLVPELLQQLEKRYRILRTIQYNQPIGRRILAVKLELGERVVRSEVEFLKDQHLIEINSSGMNVTAEGEEIIDSLKNFIHQAKGLFEVEKQLKEVLRIENVVIVPGDLEEDPSVMFELGKVAAHFIINNIKDKDVLALTGGSTLKSVVDNMPSNSFYKGITVLPARGGIGRDLEYEANTLTATLARKMNAAYRLLHIPDSIKDEKVIHSIMNESSIRDVVEELHNVNVLICGIGRADKMAQRRDLSPEMRTYLDEKGAVGEAFGSYFDEKGNAVYTIPTVGIKGQDVSKIDKLIAVAGGKEKAKAIIASLSNKPNAVLITDEGTAKEILYIL
ncbi:sugar-binding transcriptional regulator [Clostridium cellulovorans]|uniref:Transcriptional regulator, DeoR family n=1 Tax=Clostridium cellulovorans (strain ATCC 35296 / DSM 3052 / OCM 3 / 743B) TaxID=573061 RepID=D9SRX2_CLOC7|nr:sugar-binding domain-containing protein [Clostridium cellulovorans]ADL50489.1 transcriptional regulator, DeoR family [Clostridium cellulovorans 743B]